MADVFPASKHVRDIGLQAAEDLAVWDVAAGHGFVIVSKDADFRQRSLLLGAPPKVVGVLLGNTDTAAVASLLRGNVDLIRSFIDDTASAFLELP